MSEPFVVRQAMTYPHSEPGLLVRSPLYLHLFTFHDAKTVAPYVLLATTDIFGLGFSFLLLTQNVNNCLLNVGAF
jgi:hypothetical protein